MVGVGRRLGTVAVAQPLGLLELSDPLFEGALLATAVVGTGLGATHWLSYGTASPYFVGNVLFSLGAGVAAVAAPRAPWAPASDPAPETVK